PDPPAAAAPTATAATSASPSSVRSSRRPLSPPPAVALPPPPLLLPHALRTSLKHSVLQVCPSSLSDANPSSDCGSTCDCFLPHLVVLSAAHAALYMYSERAAEVTAMDAAVVSPVAIMPIDHRTTAVVESFNEFCHNAECTKCPAGVAEILRVTSGRTSWGIICDDPNDWRACVASVVRLSLGGPLSKHPPRVTISRLPSPPRAVTDASPQSPTSTYIIHHSQSSKSKSPPPPLSILRANSQSRRSLGHVRVPSPRPKPPLLTAPDGGQFYGRMRSLSNPAAASIHAPATTSSAPIASSPLSTADPTSPSIEYLLPNTPSSSLSFSASLDSSGIITDSLPSTTNFSAEKGEVASNKPASTIEEISSNSNDEEGDVDNAPFSFASFELSMRETQAENEYLPSYKLRYQTTNVVLPAVDTKLIQALTGDTIITSSTSASLTPTVKRVADVFAQDVPHQNNLVDAEIDRLRSNEVDESPHQANAFVAPWDADAETNTTPRASFSSVRSRIRSRSGSIFSRMKTKMGFGSRRHADTDADDMEGG
ncbi:hypothetical protein HDU82_003162, partial [Entophlyctis luteolus]